MAGIHTDQGWWINSLLVKKWMHEEVSSVRPKKNRYTIHMNDGEVFTCTVRVGVAEDRLLKKLGEHK